MLCQQHNGSPSDEKIPAASSLLAGGKVAHFENDTLLEKKCNLEPFLSRI